MNKFTIVKLEIPAGGHILMFYDPDGMLVGSCAGCTGKYGEDPNVAIARGFINDQSAVEWVKRKCRETHPAAEFEDKDETSRIIMAAPGDMSRARN